MTSESKDAIACAASPFRPAAAAVAVASIADVGPRAAGLPAGPYGAEVGAGTGAALPAAVDAPELETVRSGITNEPSCMRSGPETEPELGVVVSHSHESNEAAAGAARASGFAEVCAPESVAGPPLAFGR